MTFEPLFSLVYFQQEFLLFKKKKKKTFVTHFPKDTPVCLLSVTARNAGATVKQCINRAH